MHDEALLRLIADVVYSSEHAARLRVAMVGCGGQAYRSILPSFQYAPVELMATCDVQPDRADAYARQFGAPRSYSSYVELLETEELDAVFLATGYDSRGVPFYPRHAALALEAGLHVWMEKPPAASSAEIEELRAARDRAGRQVMVGFMKMFSAGVLRIRQLMSTPEFGRASSCVLRDPEMLPPLAKRGDPSSLVHLLDHVVHPTSLLYRLMGPVRRVYVEEAPNGACIATLGFVSGAIGALHMPWGQSPTSPRERLEVIGEGANLVLEHGVRLRYYRAVSEPQPAYGRGGDFTTGEQDAPLLWEMDGYSAQPFNMHLFYQGYAPEVVYFARTILDGGAIEVAGLEDAWHIMQVYEALVGPAGQVVELP